MKTVEAKALLLAVFFCLTTAGCGGGSTKTAMSASIAVPFDLLQVHSYQSQLTLRDPKTDAVLQGPVTLTEDATTSLWSAEMSDVDDQDFVAEVDVFVPQTAGNLTLARARRAIFIPKNAPSATLTFKPSDFDTSLDDDLNGVPNIDQYLQGGGQ